jgi:protein SCO1/2
MVDKNSSRRIEPASASAGLFKTFAASLVALLAGLILFLSATEGGGAFTTETARRMAVERAPQPVPDLMVIDASGMKMPLDQLFRSGKRVWIIDFVYTRCQTVCSALGSVYQQLQRRILDHGLQNRVGLMSISFDPDNDNVVALRDYAIRMRMDPRVWRIVTLTSPRDKRHLLDTFGIMVIPAPLGEFEHNAALHMVDNHGQLVRILDYDDLEQALELAQVLAR